MLRTIEKLARERLWRLAVHRKATPHLIEAAIEARGSWTLHFTVAPNASEEFLSRGISTEEQEVLARGLFLHEVGHWEICPHDIKREYPLIEAITQACRIDSRAIDVGRRVQHFANVVADIIVDTVSVVESSDSTYADAMMLFRLKALRIGRKISREANLLSQLEIELFGRHYSSYAEEVIRFLPKTRPKALDNALALFPYRDNPYRLAAWLRDDKNWPALAAGLMRVLLEPNRNYLSLRSPERGSSSGTTRGLQEALSQPLSQQANPNADGTCAVPGENNIDTEQLSSGSLESAAFHDVLVTLYEGRAANVGLAFTEGSVATIEIPVSPLLVKPIDRNNMPQLQHINWPQTRPVPKRDGSWELQPQQNELYVNAVVRGETDKGILPDLSFWLDSSGSMGYDPYAGRGEYDLVLRTIFGVFEWLKKGRFIDYLNYSVLSFSSSTRYSGWKRWHDRESIYSALFNYQGGGTRLNTAMMRRCIREASRPFVAIMITDGCLDEDILPDITAKFSGGKSFILIQIGKTSQFASRLKEAGFSVYLIRNASELKGLVLREMVRRYF